MDEPTVMSDLLAAATIIAEGIRDGCKEIATAMREARTSTEAARKEMIEIRAKIEGLFTELESNMLDCEDPTCTCICHDDDDGGDDGESHLQLVPEGEKRS